MIACYEATEDGLSASRLDCEAGEASGLGCAVLPAGGGTRTDVIPRPGDGGATIALDFHAGDFTEGEIGIRSEPVSVVISRSVCVDTWQWHEQLKSRVVLDPHYIH